MDRSKLYKAASVLFLILYVAGAAWLLLTELRELNSQAKFVGQVQELSNRVRPSMSVDELDQLSDSISALFAVSEPVMGLPSAVNPNEYFDSDAGALALFSLIDGLQNSNHDEARLSLLEISKRVAEQHSQNFTNLTLIVVLSLLGCVVVTLGVAVLFTGVFAKSVYISNGTKADTGDLDIDLDIAASSALSVAIHNTCDIQSVKSGHDYVLELDGDDLIKVTYPNYQLIEASICEMVCNSVVHGGRASAIRESAGKPSTIKIFVGIEQIENQLRVTVADDGEGIDEMHVIQHAVAKGILSAETVKTLEEGAGVKLILADGFSDAKPNHSGALKNDSLASIREAIEAVGGSVSLRNRPTVFCEFKLRLPI